MLIFGFQSELLDNNFLKKLKILSGRLIAHSLTLASTGVGSMLLMGLTGNPNALKV